VIVVVMGVSGSGKTTVGRLLASQLGWPFHEGDDYHPAANVEKMSHGVPLTDADRGPWLDALHELIARIAAGGGSAVLSCSALRQEYRERLAGAADGVVFVYLSGTFELFRDRLRARSGHFMKGDLLGSQLATLEVPQDAITVDAAEAPETIVARIRERLGRSLAEHS
jgi:gluconokinase